MKTKKEKKKIEWSKLFATIIAIVIGGYGIIGDSISIAILTSL